MTSTTIAEHGTTPDWPIQNCSVQGHRSARVHYHVTYGGETFNPGAPNIGWNKRVHESMGYHTCQGWRFQYDLPEETTREVDVDAGERLTREMCDGRTVTIEFIADRHADNPMMLSRGCQRFAPALALNNGGSVVATDHPDKFTVTMTGTVNEGQFSVPTRIGGIRSVSIGDLNGSIRRAWVKGEAAQFVEIRTGLYACTTATHNHGVFLLSTTAGEPSVIRITSTGMHYEKSESGFAHWPDCRPILVNTYHSIFGPSTTRDRMLRVRVAPGQFPDTDRVR